MSNLLAVLQRPGCVAATHSGSFHADEVLGAALLRLVNPQLTILRSRDAAELAAADILFDVGRIFDPATCRYDHHQAEYREARDNGLPYSSFGLLWRELGVVVAGSPAAAARIDRQLVQGVDAVDCGVTLLREVPVATQLSISALLGGFNPGWLDDTSAAARDGAFEEAVGYAKRVLENLLREARGADQARAEVAQGELLENGRLLVLQRDVPWRESVIEAPEYREVLFVVLPDSPTKWQINAVPQALGSFNDRKALPAAWGGLDGEALDAVVGIAGCVFCHRGRFVAAHQTREGILHMARAALAAE